MFPHNKNCISDQDLEGPIPHEYRKSKATILLFPELTIKGKVVIVILKVSHIER